MSSFIFSDCPTFVTLADVERGGKKVATGSLTLTLRNTTARALIGTLSVQPEDMARSGWFRIADATATNAASRDVECEANASQTVKIDVTVPADAPPGQKMFKLRIATERDPDNDFSDSPAVAFEVKAPPPEVKPKAPFPWWIAAVAAVAFIVVGGVIWLVLPEKTQTVPTGLKGKLLPEAIVMLSNSDVDIDPDSFSTQIVTVAGKQNFEVIDVNPAEGTALKAGQKLVLSVNAIPAAPPPPVSPCSSANPQRWRFCVKMMGIIVRPR